MSTLRVIFIDCASAELAPLPTYAVRLPVELPDDAEFRGSIRREPVPLRLEASGRHSTGTGFLRTLILEAWQLELAQHKTDLPPEAQGFTVEDLSMVTDAQVAQHPLKARLRLLKKEALAIRSVPTIFVLPETARSKTKVWRTLTQEIAGSAVNELRQQYVAAAATETILGRLGYTLTFSESAAGDAGSVRSAFDLARGDGPEETTSTNRTAKPASGFNIRSELSEALIIHGSAALTKQFKEMQRPGPILLDGRTGSGKSLAAKLFSNQLNRKPFVKINVSAIPEGMLEARMRGHVAGAFTDAKTARPGWFEQADGGVLFLDEFQRAPAWVQTQMLDVIDATSDEVVISRLGDEQQPRQFHVKLMIAVNEPLSALRESGIFREDLFYRMRCRVAFATLGEVLSDVDDSGRLGLTPDHYVRLLLAIYRWKFPFTGPSSDEIVALGRCMFPKIDADASRLLSDYRWPGNFREFERLAADLFHDMDAMGEDKISRLMVRESLSRLQLEPAATGNAVVNAMEAALKAEKFVIKRACKHLRDFKIADPETFTRRLIAHREQLSTEVRKNSKIARILARAPAS